MFPQTRRAVLVAGSAITSVLFSALLLAQVPGPGHALRKDYAMEWAGRINLFGVVAAMALVRYVLMFKRRQIASAASQWMLFIGICVMPLPVMLLGSAVGLEQAKDATHGFALNSYDINLSLEPGEHNNVTFVADRAGVFPMYCTEFCSALHLEMMGYFMVKPRT